MNEIAHLGVVQASAHVGRGADEQFNNEIGIMFADCAMWPDLLVVSTPILHFHAGNCRPNSR